MLVHPYEGLSVMFSRKGMLHLKYFLFSTLATRESGYCTKHHNCLPSKTRLNSWIILNLIPPSSLGLQTFSHFTQCIPLLERFELHENNPMTLLKFSHISNANRKVDTTYVGRASRIDFMSTSFLSFIIHYSVQQFTRFRCQSFKKANNLVLEPLISLGIPRYILILPSFVIPVELLIFSFTFPGILLPKSKEDF